MNNVDNIETLQKRIAIFLEDKDWENAKIYCDKCLDIEPENAKIYFLLLLCELKLSNSEQLINFHSDFGFNPTYLKVLKFASENEKLEFSNIYNENCYIRAKAILNVAKTRKQYKKAINILIKNSEYKDAKELIDLSYTKINKMKTRCVKTIRWSIISFATILFLSSIFFVYSFNEKQNRLQDINSSVIELNERDAKLAQEFAPTQNKIDEANDVVEEAEAEKRQQENVISNLELDIKVKEGSIQDYTWLILRNSSVSSDIMNAYKSAIVKWGKEIDTIKSQIKKEEKVLSAKEEKVRSSRENYNKVLEENKTAIDKYNSTKENIKKEKEALYEESKEIKESLENFPYNFITYIIGLFDK